MKEITERIAKLVDLKSIITLTLVTTLVIVIFRNITISDETIKTLFVSVTSSCFTYFFTKKKNDKSEG